MYTEEKSSILNAKALSNALLTLCDLIDLKIMDIRIMKITLSEIPKIDSLLSLIDPMLKAVPAIIESSTCPQEQREFKRKFEILSTLYRTTIQTIDIYRAEKDDSNCIKINNYLRVCADVILVLEQSIDTMKSESDKDAVVKELSGINILCNANNNKDDNCYADMLNKINTNLNNKGK